MPSFSRDQVRRMIDNRPPGMTPEQVVTGLIKGGNQLEGFGQQQNQPTGQYGGSVNLNETQNAPAETPSRGFFGNAVEVGKGLLKSVTALPTEAARFGQSASNWFGQTGVGKALGGAIQGTARSLLSPEQLQGLQESARGAQTALQQGTQGSWVTEAANPYQQGGKFVGEVAQAFIPIGGEAKAAQLTGRLAKTFGLGERAAQVLGTAGKIGARVGENALMTGVQTGSAGQAGTAGLITGGLEAASPILKVGGRLLSEALGITTGVGGKVLRQAFENPQAARVAMKEGEEAMPKIAEDVKSAFNKLKDERRVAYREQMAKIKEIPQSLDISPVKNNLEELMSEGKFNIGKNADGTLDFSRSTISNPADKTAIEDLYNTVQGWGLKKGDRTPAGVDLLKRKLDDFYISHGPGKAFTSELLGTTRKLLHDNVPGYQAMTKGYEDALKLEREISSALSLGDRNVVDTTVRKLASALKDNNELRESFVKLLEEKGTGDILSRISGAQLSQWSPRGLAKVLAGGIGLTGGIHALPGLALASPRLVGEATAALGKGAQYLERAPASVIQGLKKATGRAVSSITSQLSPSQESSQ